MPVSHWLATLSDSIEPLNTDTPFLEFHGLDEGQLWVLGLWLVFFFFNIVGEEIWWHGYILPRQEAAFGAHAWIVNGVLWTVFHLTFGPELMLLLLPVMFIVPGIVQRRRNTTIGIFIHGIYNGPIFVAIALNVI